MKFENMVNISHYTGTGYKPLVDFQSWRVAVLRYIDGLLPEMIDRVECHLETDEVFILTEGKCILFLADVEEAKIIKIHAINMEPNRLYNVKMGVYHSHTLSKDAHVIVVENQDTGSHNSASISLDQTQIEEICEMTRRLW